MKTFCHPSVRTRFCKGQDIEGHNVRIFENRSTPSWPYTVIVDGRVFMSAAHRHDPYFWMYRGKAEEFDPPVEGSPGNAEIAFEDLPIETQGFFREMIPR